MLDAEFLRILQLLDVVARKRMRGLQRGERQSMRKGSSAEFLDHRPYAAGDDLRHLDWHVYHRFGELVTKLYREEQNLDLFVMVDTSASMDLEGTRKREYALKLAAAMAYIGMSNMDRSTVMPFSDGLRESSWVGSGRGQVWGLFRFLEECTFGGTTDLARAASQLALRRRRRALVMLISDFYDVEGISGALRILRGKGNDVGVLHLIDPTEQSPDLRGELRLEDVETGDARELTVTARLTERYRQAFVANQDRVQSLARRYELGGTVASTDRDFLELVTEVITSGGLVA